MDLGIAGRKTIVCAASKGLGRGCAMALAREGVDLVINARSAEPLEATAQQIRNETGVYPSLPSPPILPVNRGAARSFRHVRRRIYWSTTPAGRRRAIFATGKGRNGCRRSMPTC